MDRSTGRALGLTAGFLADRLLGDPRRWHPVAGFGRVAAALERVLYADDRRHGVAFAGLLVGAATAVGAVGERVTRDRPLVHAVLVGAATWAALGGRSLGREATEVSRLLTAGELSAAREQVTHLVGRDPSGLDAVEIARATVESVAENTSDAVVAPLLVGALFGIPGVLGYRAANTLDAMVGHRSERYRRFGWASARLDDLFNLLPARVAAASAAIMAPLVGGHPRQAYAVWRRDASRHPSPNAGQVEAAFAGALEVTLGGRNVYGSRVEQRPTMGTGPEPGVADVARSVRLAEIVDRAALGCAVSLVLGPRLLRRRAR